MVKGLHAQWDSRHLCFRFSAASIYLLAYVDGQKNGSVILHPALEAQLRNGPSGPRRNELQQRLLAAWDQLKAPAAGPFSRRWELLAALELALAQDEEAFVRYIETIQAMLTPMEQGDLWHLTRSRFRGTKARDQIRKALYPSDRDLVPPGHIGNCLTAPQALVAERLIRLGQIFFDENRPRFGIEPRLSPLVIGRTGAGKGHVISYVAKNLGCHILHITYGDWIVSGASGEYVPTLWTILLALIQHDNLLVVLDEIDKFDSDVSSASMTSWSRSACNELWALLDRRLPVSEFMQSPRSIGTSALVNEAELHKKVKTKLWIVGIGTWQHMHKADRSRIGFPSGSNSAKSESIASKLAKEASIPAELLYRFNPTPLELPYPSLEDIESLLQRTGVADAAKKRGLVLNLKELDLSRGGMRVIEDLVTQVILTEAEAA